MTIGMKRFPRDPRRERPRTMGRATVWCETLESRRLLSSGMHSADGEGGMATASGGWESRWAEMSQMGLDTSSVGQNVSNLANVGPREVMELAPGGAQNGPVMMSSWDATAGSSSTNSSVGVLPGAGEVAVGGAQNGPVIVSTGGATGGLSTTTASVGMLPGAGEVGVGGAQSGPVIVSSGAATAGSSTTSSSISTLEGAGEVGAAARRAGP